MRYKLFLDDKQNPPGGCFVARTVLEAKAIVAEIGELPEHMYLDHDLGRDSLGRSSDSLEFLNWLMAWYGGEFDMRAKPPTFNVISTNPVGRKRIELFMLAWEKEYAASLLSSMQLPAVP